MPPPTIPETVQKFYDIIQEKLGNASKEGKHKQTWSGDSSTSKDYVTELSM